MNRTEKLIKDLVSNPNGIESDGRTTKLLEEYFAGSPVESLRSLLSSGNERLVGEGTWIASELPTKGSQLIDDIASLLGHSSRKARFFAPDCILSWADATKHGRHLSATLFLLDDQDAAVRWKAICFLSMISPDQLDSAIHYLAEHHPDSPYLVQLRWIQDQEVSPSGVAAGLESDDALRRKAAAAAAYRHYRLPGRNLNLLRRASTATDPEVADFGSSMLRIAEAEL